MPQPATTFSSYLIGSSSPDDTYRQKALPIEIIKDELYFTSFKSRSALQSFMSLAGDDCIFFTVDRVLNYEPFAYDFGPLNLGKLFRFFQIVDMKLRDVRNSKKKIYFYTATDEKKRSNAAYIIGSYLVIRHEENPDKVWNMLCSNQPEYLAFRDASMGHCSYKLTVGHCLQALFVASKLKFVDMKNFDISSYERYERVENGDLTVIIPNKFVHFSGPSDSKRDADGYPTHNPEHYVPIFKKLGVTDIIRLNKICYDRENFVRHGFQHHDLYFTDGTTPSPILLQKFLTICENAKGAIAVHCKAGLGRTGTCVGAFMMKHYSLTATETIGWLRICRPGSVLGPQQQFLEKIQTQMWTLGDQMRQEYQVEKLKDKKECNLSKKSKEILDEVDNPKDDPEDNDDSLLPMKSDDSDQDQRSSSKKLRASDALNLEDKSFIGQGSRLMRQKLNAQKTRVLF